MILAHGEIFDSEKQNDILEELPLYIKRTLQGKLLDPEIVIETFDAFGRKIRNGELQDVFEGVQMDGLQNYIEIAAKMMSREYLEYKLQIELGNNNSFENKQISSKRVPLGVLFHIAAGNMDMIPVVSVAEGLLAGNINILKLPRVDTGITVKILKKLVDFEPRLKDYIYVFDTPSSDIIAMKKMADMSDGIVVWGGDEAIKAVRGMARPGTRLIEWGHKLGFCYISEFENEEGELSELARHIMQTKQLLCSSCQVIYIDTDNIDVLKAFAERFLVYLENAAEQYPITEIGALAEITLRRYASRLEEAVKKDGEKKDSEKEIVFQGNKTSVTVKTDNELELSYMYGNCMVKPLLKKDIVNVLRERKEYLQTAGLICKKEVRSELTDAFIRSGAERVTSPGNMSFYFDGEAHDGEYPLLRYTRIVNVEKV